jgi:glucokinase
LSGLISEAPTQSFGFVDRSGKILAEDQIMTKHYDEPEVFVAALYEKMMLTAQKAGMDLEILGFGIGAPMGNINKGTIEYPADMPWKGIIPLADILQRHTSLPVIVTNDANAAAVGEMIYGGARDMKNFVVITLGTASAAASSLTASWSTAMTASQAR